MLLRICTYYAQYAAVLINFTYYAQYYAHVKDLCLGSTLLVLLSLVQNKILIW